eukprot:COSAG05_NODE_1531_length_4620_cov_3.897810_5_plen_129_part_00
MAASTVAAPSSIMSDSHPAQPPASQQQQQQQQQQQWHGSQRLRRLLCALWLHVFFLNVAALHVQPVLEFKLDLHAKYATAVHANNDRDEEERQSEEAEQALAGPVQVDVVREARLRRLDAPTTSGSAS